MKLPKDEDCVHWIKKKIIIGIVAVAVIVAAVVFANNRGMFGEGKASVVTYASDSKTEQYVTEPRNKTIT